MNRHSLDLLDFNIFAKQIADYALSGDLAAELAADPALLLVETRDEAERIYACVDTLRRLSQLGHLPQFRTVPSCARLLELVGGRPEQLEPAEFAALLRLLEFDSSYRELCEIVPVRNGPSQGDLAEVQAWVGEAEDTSSLAAKFRRVLRDDGSLDEEAIPQLRAIRNEIQRGNQALAALAKTSISEAGEGNFSSGQPVFRDGRVMLPVKTDSRTRVSGFIQGMSDSGQTVYLETPELQNRNNAQVQLHAQYQIEVRKLYRELSDLARDNAGQIAAAAQRLGRYDLLQVRLAWQRNCSGVIPRFSDTVSLVEARHLLIGRGVVPVSISYAPGTRILVVTGPNAGGKTIGLKLFGLCAVFARAGLTLPAAEGSCIPWFETVLADIGDEQSVLQAKSTFSAHMANIATIVRSCGPQSLVLLDELGTGTDPEEGGALGLAILEHLARTGATVYLTTHHSALKAWASTADCAANASMLFDEATNKPVYRFVYGMPGLSHALDAARGAGVPARILERAEAIIAEGGSSYDTLFRTLQSRIAEVEGTKDELQVRQAELERNLAELEAKRTNLVEREAELEAEFSAEGSKLLSTMRSRMETALQDFLARAQNMFAETGGNGAGGELRADLLNQAGRLREELAAESEPLQARLARSSEAAKARRKEAGTKFDLRPGSRVRIKNSTEILTLVSEKKDGSWRAASKAMKLTIRPDSILSVVEEDSKPELVYDRGRELGSRSAEVYYAPTRMELVLDIRGRRVEEALGLVDSQLQAALIQGSTVFGIVHGKGTGALQAAVHDFLKSNSSVQSFQFARPEDGGTGKTWVFLA